MFRFGRVISLSLLGVALSACGGNPPAPTFDEASAQTLSPMMMPDVASEGGAGGGENVQETLIPDSEPPVGNPAAAPPAENPPAALPEGNPTAALPEENPAAALPEENPAAALPEENPAAALPEENLAATPQAIADAFTEGDDEVRLNALENFLALEALGGRDTIILASDLTGYQGISLDGGSGYDVFEVVAGGLFGHINVAGGLPGNLLLMNVEAIHLNGGEAARGLLGTLQIELIWLQAGRVRGAGVYSGPGANRIILEGARIDGILNGEGGDDRLELMSGYVGGDIYGGGGNDVIALDANLEDGSLTIGGMVDGGAGSDELLLGGNARVERLAPAGQPPRGPHDLVFDNIEIIHLNGGAVGQGITGSASGELFRLSAGSLSGGLAAGGGADVIELAGTPGEALSLDGALDGGPGVDTLRLAAGARFDAVLLDGSENPAPGLLAPGNVEAFHLNGGSVARAVGGGAAGETFQLTSGSVGQVEGREGADLFIVDGDLSSGALVLAGPLDGGPGADVFRLAEGGRADAVSQHTGDDRSANGVLALDAVEVIEIASGGQVAGDVRGGSAPETIVLDAGQRGAVMGAIFGGNETGPGDRIELISGSVMRVHTGQGNDLVRLAGDAVAGGLVIGGREIAGGGGVDVLEIAAGARVGPLRQDNPQTLPEGAIAVSGFEVFHLNGGQVEQEIRGSEFSEIFQLSGGSTGAIRGGDGGDLFIINGRFTGTIHGGAGFDTIRYEGIVACITPNDVPVPFDQCAGPGISQAVGATGIERNYVSSAVALYGTMGNALMSFGEASMQGMQTGAAGPPAGGEALAFGSDPVSGRLIWAHRTEARGRSAGRLNLAGLGATDRIVHDYDLALTRQGLDLPLAAVEGRLVLRAAVHALRGRLRLEGARGQVDGYGAGIGLAWQGGALTLHAAGLADVYDVSTATGSGQRGRVSAFNLMGAAGAELRYPLLQQLSLHLYSNASWQALALDEAEALLAAPAVFRNAGRFAARTGARLQSENWHAGLNLVHRRRSGGGINAGLWQTYEKTAETAFELQLGGRADLAPGVSFGATTALYAPLGGIKGSAAMTFDLRLLF